MKRNKASHTCLTWIERQKSLLHQMLGRGRKVTAQALERQWWCFSVHGPCWADSLTVPSPVFRLCSRHLHAARRLQPVCGGVPEKPLEYLDYETLWQSPGKGHLPDQQALADQKVVPGQQNIFVSGRASRALCSSCLTSLRFWPRAGGLGGNGWGACLLSQACSNCACEHLAAGQGPVATAASPGIESHLERSV